VLGVIITARRLIVAGRRRLGGGYLLAAHAGKISLFSTKRCDIEKSFHRMTG